MLLLLVLLLVLLNANIAVLQDQQQVVVVPGGRLVVSIELRSGLPLHGASEGEAALQLMDKASALHTALVAEANTNHSPLLADVLLINSTFYSKLFSCQHYEFVLAEPLHGCALSSRDLQGRALAGKYLVVSRGSCSVHAKAMLAAQLGVAGVIVVADEGDGLGRAVERDPGMKSDKQLAAERRCRRRGAPSGMNSGAECLAAAARLTYLEVPVIAVSHASLQRWREELRQAAEGGRRLSMRAAPAGMCVAGASSAWARVMPGGKLVIDGAVYSLSPLVSELLREQPAGSGAGVTETGSDSPVASDAGSLAELCELLGDPDVPRKQKVKAQRRAATLGLPWERVCGGEL